MNRPLLVLALVADLLPGAAFAQAKFDDWLCCNMRTDGSWISDITAAAATRNRIWGP